MSTLTVLALQNEQEAEQMMGTIKNLQAQNLIKVDDAAVLTRKPNGNPKIHQAHDLVGRFAIEIAGRLVGQHERGLIDQRPGDRDTLALPA